MYGVIDIGSNSIRLVIYKVENNTIVSMLNKKYSAGLAGYVDEKHNLSKEGIQKAITVLLEIKKILKSIKIEQLYIFATASLRNIDNTKSVIDKIKKETGYKVVVLSGDEEAYYDYYGVIHSSDIKDGIMVDIGGGSTEVVVIKGREVLFSHSIPIGSLNTYAEYVNELIPTKTEIKKIQKSVTKELDRMMISNKFNTKTMVTVGGSARAALSLYNSLQNKPSTNTSYNTAFLSNVLHILDTDRTQFINLVLQNKPERIHTIVPGLVILDTIASYYSSKTITTSKFGAREGYLYMKLQKKGLIK